MDSMTHRLALRRCAFHIACGCSLAFGSLPAINAQTNSPPAPVPVVVETGSRSPLLAEVEQPISNQQTLQLSDAESIALAHNPSLARAASLVRAAQGNWEQVGLAPNPTVGYSGQQIGSRGLAEQDGVVISQEIVRGGKLSLNRAVASHEVARARHELALQQQKVLTDVRIAFYETLIAQRQAEQSQQLVAISEKSRQTADRLLAAKEIAKLDVLQAQLTLDEDKIQARNATHRYTAAWSSFTAVLGQPTLAPMILQGQCDESPQTFDFQTVLQQLQTTSPEIRIALTEVERARCAYARARVEPKPNLRVDGLINARDNGIGGSSDGALVLTAPLPVWNRNQGAITQAHHQLHAAEQALQQLELDLQNRLAPVFERYENAKHQVEQYQTQILPATRETLELTEVMLKSGEIAFDRLLLTQRNYSRMNQNYLEHLRALRIAEAELQGMLLSGSLQRN
jgi:outer membrane protein, heavy metal efflux system